MRSSNYFRKPYTLIRKTGGRVVNNEIVDQVETVIIIKGSLQPATGDDTQSTPQGRYTSAQFKFFTNFKARSSSEYVDQNADVIIIDDIRYEVISVFPWQNGVLEHYKLILAQTYENANL